MTSGKPIPINPAKTTAWSSVFKRELTSPITVTRRGFVIGGLSAFTPVSVSVAMPVLDITVHTDAIAFNFAGRTYHMRRTGFGVAHGVEVSRDGGSWTLRFARLRVVGLSEDLSITLRIARHTTGWHVSGQAARRYASSSWVPLHDWLIGLSLLDLAPRYEPSARDPRFKIDPAQGTLSMASSGALSFTTKAPHRIAVAPIALDVKTTTWSHPTKPADGWSILFEDAAVADSQIRASTLGRGMTLHPILTGAGAAVLHLPPNRRKAGLIFWDGPATLRATNGAEGSAADIHADIARAVLRTGRGAPGLRLWAPPSDLRAKVVVGQTEFILVGLKHPQATGQDFEIEILGGRAAPLRTQFGLRRLRHGIEGADFSEWEFPDSPVKLHLAQPEAVLELAKAKGSATGKDGFSAGPGDDVGVEGGVDTSDGDGAVGEVDKGVIAIDATNASYAVDVSTSLLSMFRARDLFDAKFGFSQFALVRDKTLPSGAELRPFGSAQNPSLLVVHFGAQHVEEQVYLTEPTAADGAVSEARASGPSRVAFRIDETHEPWQLTLEQFTKWNGLALNVSGRAFSEDSTVQEQLDYVGIGKGIGRRRAMELIRASVERDRVMDTARPDSRHITTALEVRNRMILSPSATGSQVMALATDTDEGRLRGNQLWSARVVPAPPSRKTLAPSSETDAEVKVDGESKTLAPPSDDIATAAARDLRVVWVRGVDLGFLHSANVTLKDNIPPWAPDPDLEGQPYTFERAVSYSQMREMMTMTSIPALMAKRRIIAFHRGTENQATIDEIKAFYDPKSPVEPPDLVFTDDPHGQVVAVPEGYTYPWSIPLPSMKNAGGQDPSTQVGIAVPKTLGPSKLVITPWGGSFQSRTVFEPYAPEPVNLPEPVNPPVEKKTKTPAYPGADWGPALNLELIQQHIHLGEDIFVVTADKGFLMPLGHRATYVEVTRRMFTPNAAHHPNAQEVDQTAYPIKTSYLAVNRPDKTFPALGQPFKGRAGPGRQRIRFLTTISPPIRNPKAGDEAEKVQAGRVPKFANDQELVFWPRLTPGDEAGGSDLLWEVMIDDDPEPHRLPLLFVNNSVAQNPALTQQVVEYYRNGGAPKSARTIQSGGQPHRFATESSEKDTRFKTRSMLMSVTGHARGEAPVFKSLFGAPANAVREGVEDFSITSVMEGADQPGFYPILESAVIQVQSIDRMLGRANGATNVAYNRQWVDSGFEKEANPSELYLDVLDRLPVDFSSDSTAAGGFAKPNMDVAHLSRMKGPIGGIKRYESPEKQALASRSAPGGARSAASQGIFDPNEFLGGAANSNFLGLFTLQSVLKAARMEKGAPEITEQTSYDVEEGTGKNAFKKLERAIIGDGETTGVKGAIEAAVEAFQDTLASAFAGIAGPDGQIDIGDFYPDLENALGKLRTSLDIAETEARKLSSGLPDISDDTNQEIRKARDKLGNVTAGLVSAVKDVVAAIDAIIEDPVPQVVDSAIEEIRGNWHTLRKVMVGDLQALIRGALDEFLDELLFEAFREALPFLELIDSVGQTRDEAAQFIAVLMGYARRSEVELRAEVRRRVNAGLAPLPGKPTASQGEIDEYINATVAGDTDRLAILFEEDMRDYLDGRFDEETKLLEHVAESLLAEHFGVPLEQLYQRARKVRRLIFDQADAGQEALIDALAELVRAAIEAALKSGALREISTAFEAATDLCKQATAEIAGLKFEAGAAVPNPTPLFGQFDAAEVELVKVRDKLLQIRLPAKPAGLTSARAKALAAIKRLLVRLDEGKFLAREMAAQVKARVEDANAASTEACLALSDLEPVGQLFKLQATSLAMLGDVGAALKALIDEADAATSLPERTAFLEAATKSGRADDLAAIKTGVTDATQTLGIAIKHAVGLGQSTDFASLTALKDAVKANAEPFGAYARDFEAALGQIQTEAASLASQIDSINTPEDAIAVVRLARDFAARESKAVAGFLSQATRYGDDLLADVETWLLSILGQALGLAIPLYRQVALPVLRTVQKALIVDNVPTALGYFVRRDITRELVSAAVAVETEVKAMETLLEDVQAGAGFNDVRSRLSDFIRIPFDAANTPGAAKPMALPGAVSSVRELAELLLAGQFSDIVSLEQLKHEIEAAILSLLPVKVGVVFPWATPIGDFPPGKPIFEVATPRTQNEDGEKILNADRYWTIDDGKGGEENLRNVFYEELATPNSITEADFQKRKGDLVLDAGASYHLITGDRQYWADAWLHPFTLNILPGFDIVKLHFRAAKFTAGKDKSTRVSVLPEDFELGKQVQFISALTSYLSGGGKQGPYYDINLLPPQIEVGVRYNLPTIPLGPIIFSQVSINVAAILPLAEGELLFKASIGRRNRPFLISIPPYGGGGHIGMTANSRIIGFEASMEYGAVVPLDLALIKGHGQVTAGVYISKTIGGLTVFSGYLRAIGEGSIGIFGIAVHIELSLTHVNGNMIGRVFVAFTFSVGFIDVTFSFEIERQINGSREKNAERFAAYNAAPLIPSERSPILVHSPPRMTRWTDYQAAYPAGLILPGTVAEAQGDTR